MPIDYLWHFRLFRCLQHRRWREHAATRNAPLRSFTHHYHFRTLPVPLPSSTRQTRDYLQRRDTSCRTRGRTYCNQRIVFRCAALTAVSSRQTCLDEQTSCLRAAEYRDHSDETGGRRVAREHRGMAWAAAQTLSNSATRTLPLPYCYSATKFSFCTAHHTYLPLHRHAPFPSLICRTCAPPAHRAPRLPPHHRPAPTCLPPPTTSPLSPTPAHRHKRGWEGNRKHAAARPLFAPTLTNGETLVT